MGHLQQPPDGDPFKAGGLLKGVTDAQTSPLGDGKAGDILAVQQYLAGGGPLNAHDQFGQGGFSAAVGAGDHCDLAAGHGEAEVIQDGGFPAIGDVEGEIFYFKHKKLLVFQGLVQVGDRPRFLEKAGDQPAI